jgi:hypothetical protein
MESLELVEGATHVAIVVEKDTSITIKTNCDYRDLHYLLAQSAHATLNELFQVKTKQNDD